jgi:PAS domain S-box-containing protein
MTVTTAIGGLLAIHDEVITGATGDWQRMTGWTPQELAGRNIYALVHPDDLAESQQRVEAFEQGQASYGYTNRWRTADGGWVRLSWSPVEVDGQWYGHAIEVPDWVGVDVSPAVQDGADVGDLPRLDHGEPMNETELDQDRIAELTAECEGLRERCGDLERERDELRMAIRASASAMLAALKPLPHDSGESSINVS